MCCMYTVYSGIQEWVIQIPSIPILVFVLFPSLHLRIKFLLLVYRVLQSKSVDFFALFNTGFGVKPSDLVHTYFNVLSTISVNFN